MSIAGYPGRLAPERVKTGEQIRELLEEKKLPKKIDQKPQVDEAGLPLRVLTGAQ